MKISRIWTISVCWTFLAAINQLFLPRHFPSIYCTSFLIGVGLSCAVAAVQVGFVSMIIVSARLLLARQKNKHKARTFLARRVAAFAIDCVVSYVVMALLMVILHSFVSYCVVFTLALFGGFTVMLFRDILTGYGSMGKRLCGLSVSHTKGTSATRVTAGQSIVRNFLPAIFMLVTFLSLGEEHDGQSWLQIASVLVVVSLLVDVFVAIKTGQRPEDHVLDIFVQKRTK